MQFELTEEQISVKEAARDFTQQELLPGVIDRDRQMLHPTEQVKKMGAVWIHYLMYWLWKKSAK